MGDGALTIGNVVAVLTRDAAYVGTLAGAGNEGVILTNARRKPPCPFLPVARIDWVLILPANVESIMVHPWPAE